ncbi:TlpA family protein disulfide reductase [Robiginitalea aurantiaca]|uniref:Thioredoxin family protein n=1 Tax=Robiginitalea aurantiaca TaxID=3056915 RepID=A0ABT7WIK0_9FLAO|nr:thioredoxin family protein [Robiginitalea aurantiaca]MDM9632742.1 thioredoxin family protein [Robiginitalea aurantiaca]
MKNILNFIVLAFLLCLSSCAIGPGHNAVKVPDGDSVILVGTTGFEALEEAPFSDWYTSGYGTFTADSSQTEVLTPLLEEVDIVVFMGTWCEDSHREIPKFVRILEATGYPIEAIEVIAMTRDKTTPQEYEAGQNITNIPTFIFSKDGEELGRIVEFPVENLESDMLKILSGQPYKHAYDWD